MEIDENALTDEQIVRARHGFYAMLSFIDHKIGEVLSGLQSSGLSEDTIVVVTADHGSMLGERGLWGIVNFFEWAMRVPLIVRAPGRFAPHSVKTPISLVDLMPTLLDLATDGHPPTLATPIEGTNLVPLVDGENTARDPTIYAELSAEGCVSPCVMIREGDYKFVHSEVDPPLLFNVDRDPTERVNLAARPEHAERLGAFLSKVRSKWELQRWSQEIELSRQRRVLIYETFEKGNAPVWDYAVDNHPWRFYQRSFREPWQDTEHKAVLE